MRGKNHLQPQSIDKRGHSQPVFNLYAEEDTTDQKLRQNMVCRLSVLVSLCQKITSKTEKEKRKRQS